MMQEGPAGDVNVGVGVGDFGVLRQHTWRNLTEGADDGEVLVVGAEALAKGELVCGAWVFSAEHRVAEPEHRTLGRKLATNEGFNLCGI